MLLGMVSLLRPRHQKLFVFLQEIRPGIILMGAADWQVAQPCSDCVCQTKMMNIWVCWLVPTRVNEGSLLDLCGLRALDLPCRGLWLCHQCTALVPNGPRLESGSNASWRVSDAKDRHSGQYFFGMRGRDRRPVCMKERLSASRSKSLTDPWRW